MQGASERVRPIFATYNEPSGTRAIAPVILGQIPYSLNNFVRNVGSAIAFGISEPLFSCNNLS